MEEPHKVFWAAKDVTSLQRMLHQCAGLQGGTQMHERGPWFSSHSPVPVPALLRERECEFGGTTVSLCHKSQGKFSPKCPKGWQSRSPQPALRCHKKQGLGNGLSLKTDLPALSTSSLEDTMKQQEAQESIFGGGCMCVGEIVPLGIWSVSSSKYFYLTTLRNMIYSILFSFSFISRKLFLSQWKCRG